MSSTATAHVAHSEAFRGLYKPAIHQCSEQNIIPTFCGPSGSSEKELIMTRQFNIKCAPYPDNAHHRRNAPPQKLEGGAARTAEKSLSIARFLYFLG
ncbi:hypothetical protein [Gluconacetobacter asukensis]|uniref:Uncharacterized protein n=1 Tax=Gluconacetobacter asukensis TaxID=1017181 RepID=A0A7W4P1S8_9PROT|nr:hypothetical protein [Gluconacetobacter asukensis]MBB2174074.1 hypothetical protein [Gluconacetobacter asukensis]